MGKNAKYLILVVALGVLAWYQVLNFWFFKGYEALWLMGNHPHTLINLIRGHSFLYYLDWKVFGWNPWGWYFTSLSLHIFATVILFYLILALTKHRILSFIVAIVFVANTSYNDVLTWGSFNSYYPLILIWILLALFTFYKFKETNRFFFLVASVIFSILAFFTRETGITIVPLITIFDILFSGNIKSKKTLAAICVRQAPFYIAVIAFLIIRSWYGGQPGDGADENVKLQIRFVQDKLFLEYAKASFLTFGKLIPPQIIPYPFLNWIREFLTHFLDSTLLYKYFFPLLGWIFFVGFGVIIYLLRKNKEYFHLLIFFWFWIGIYSLFVSLVIPSTHGVLVSEYIYSTMRYRYFAFVGTSALFGIIMIITYEKLARKSIKNARIIIAHIVLSVVIINLVLIWRIEHEVYRLHYKPGKDFYTKLHDYYPTFPKEAVFYLYPHGYGLGDYFGEWALTKDTSYPSLVGEPFRVESQVIAVLDKIKKGKIKLPDVFFFDYDAQKGLIDRTKDARNLLMRQQEYVVPLKRVKDNLYTSEVFKGPEVELPYTLGVQIESIEKNPFVGKKPDSSRFQTLVDYNVGRMKYLNAVSIKTDVTMSQRVDEPFFFVLPHNLIDGNTGFRSSWIADSWTPWVQVDLGKTMEIAAVSWGSQNGQSRIPATYSISVSVDGEKWEKVKTVKNNTKPTSIDILDKPTAARYVKMNIHTTTGGNFVSLDEFDVIDTNAKKILDFYQDRDELLNDSRDMFQFVSSSQDLEYADAKGLVSFWGKLSWETNMAFPIDSNPQYVYFLYTIDASNKKVLVQIPEAEVFAASGYFLNKYINAVTLDFGNTPFILHVNAVQLVPIMKL